MPTLHETIGREALIHLSNQYSSVADALMELIDNPFDYRRGQPLTVEVHVDKSGDQVTVLDYGGQGMNGSTLADWISWGTGHAHAESDIGRYHVGGKLAAIYLAQSLEIISRKAEEREIYRFKDSEWGTRTEILAPREPETVPITELPPNLAELAAGDLNRGFTLIRLTKLKPHRYEVGILEAKLGNAYRALIDSGQCTLKVNGGVVPALAIPYAPTYRDREIIIATQNWVAG